MGDNRSGLARSRGGPSGTGAGGRASTTKPTARNGTLDPPDQPAGDEPNDDTETDDCSIHGRTLKKVAFLMPMKTAANKHRKTRFARQPE